MLIVRVLNKTGDMNTPTNYLLGNMAVSDVIAILMLALYVCGKFACKLSVITEICIMFSSITLTILARFTETFKNRIAADRSHCW